MYISRPDFHTSERGWLAYSSDQLFYKPLQDKHAELTSVNVDTLMEEHSYVFEGGITFIA